MQFQEILQEIINICRKNQVQELFLFGSYATRTATQTSDIDIIVKGVSNIEALKEQLEKFLQFVGKPDAKKIPGTSLFSVPGIYLFLSLSVTL